MDSILLFIVFLLLANAFFVGAEFGLISARRSTIEPLARAGSRKAKVTLGAMEQVSLMLAAAQLGITLCSLGLGAIGEPYIAHFLEGPFHELGLASWMLHPISFAIALIILTYLHVVFGEMIPKNIALAKPERVALALAPLLVLVVKIFYPMVITLNVMANFICRLLGVRPKDEVASAFTRDEVAGFVEESHREGLISEDEEHLLSGTLHFDERTVRSVLLPIDKLTTITSKTTPAQIEQLAAETGYSRFPVRNMDGSLSGYLHLKDILDIRNTDRNKPVPARKHRPLAVMKVREPLRSALTIMRHRRSHMAKVMDGKNVIGIVALEDIVEEIVGTIQDESQKQLS